MRLLESFIYICMLLSHFSCVLLFATLLTVACQVPLSMGFSKLEWAAMPHSRGFFQSQGLNPHLLFLLHWQVGSFTTSISWDAPQNLCVSVCLCLCVCVYIYININNMFNNIYYSTINSTWISLFCLKTMILRKWTDLVDDILKI